MLLSTAVRCPRRQNAYTLKFASVLDRPAPEVAAGGKAADLIRNSPRTRRLATAIPDHNAISLPDIVSRGNANPVSALIAPRPPKVVSLLEVDADLGGGIEPNDARLARHHLTAPTVELRPPVWDPAVLEGRPRPGWLGVVIVSGLLLRIVTVGRRSSCELVGRGDVVRPWDADADYGPLPIKVTWRVLEPTVGAVLTDGFAERAARWPTIADELMRRTARRGRFLALTQAVNQLPRIHERLVVVLWLLAERWGRMGANGIALDLPLTHETLAMLVGAQRPSVTVALHRLDADGLVRRTGRRAWLITPQAVAALQETFPPARASSAG